MDSLQSYKSSVSNCPSFIEDSVRGYLQYCCNNFQAGCISQFLDIWRQLTSDQEILSTVRGVSIDNTPHQHYLPKTNRSHNEAQLIASEIHKLLSGHVVELTGHTRGEIISDIFLRSKKDGCHRIILNLKKVYQYSTKVHIIVDTLQTVIKLIEKDCFISSIDLRDASYSVPIAREDRKFLQFISQGFSFLFYVFAQQPFLCA